MTRMKRAHVLYAGLSSCSTRFPAIPSPSPALHTLVPSPNRCTRISTTNSLYLSPHKSRVADGRSLKPLSSRSPTSRFLPLPSFAFCIPWLPHVPTTPVAFLGSHTSRVLQSHSSAPTRSQYPSRILSSLPRASGPFFPVYQPTFVAWAILPSLEPCILDEIVNPMSNPTISSPRLLQYVMSFL